MANGLPTSTQLQAFRQTLWTYGTCHTLWMSATVCPQWLKTVDFPALSDKESFPLGTEDFASPGLAQRRNAAKTLHKLDLNVPAKSGGYDVREAARVVLGLHRQGSRTMAVVNTVGRAQRLYDELSRLKPQAELVLVHSRFRPADRQTKTERLTAPVDGAGPGRIVVATQAIEAGVDISARTLVTELAPWTSLVQRFGRCNRRGESSDAAVHLIDLPEKEAAPYDAQELDVARQRLQELEGNSVAPASLPSYEDGIIHRVVLRQRDLLGLFDTAADLSGSYLDVSRFVRGTDELDVHVFWRMWEGNTPPASMPAPGRYELCSVPIDDIKGFLGAKRKGRRTSEADVEDETGEADEETREAGDASPASGAQRRQAWRWDHLFGQWQPVSAGQVYPGQALLLRASDGGYTADQGWSPTSFEPVAEAARPQGEQAPEKMDDESTNTDKAIWITLRDHSLHVWEEAQLILKALPELSLPPEVRSAVLVAAHYHDWGKAHVVFQQTMLSNLAPEEAAPRKGQAWAKRGQASQSVSKNHGRPYFRHEVASALALLAAGVLPPGEAQDLAAYLAMAHHGKVRLAMRSPPKARDQSPDRYFLLGFRMSDDATAGDDWKRDNVLPPTDLGGGETAAELLIDMSIAQIGVSSNGERSWLDRTLDLRERLGPFRLAYLEALLRAADVRASKAEQEGRGGNCG